VFGTGCFPYCKPHVSEIPSAHVQEMQQMRETYAIQAGISPPNNGGGYNFQFWDSFSILPLQWLELHGGISLLFSARSLYVREFGFSLIGRGSKAPNYSNITSSHHFLICLVIFQVGWKILKFVLVWWLYIWFAAYDWTTPSREWHPSWSKGRCEESTLRDPLIYKSCWWNDGMHIQL